MTALRAVASAARHGARPPAGPRAQTAVPSEAAGTGRAPR
ncbi:hypothetical protein SUDANB121_05642 [Nocardiopsis dassonvillei]